MLTLGGDETHLAHGSELAQRLSALTGEAASALHVPEPYSAAARAKAVAALNGAAKPRALILLPHTSALTPSASSSGSATSTPAVTSSAPTSSSAGDASSAGLASRLAELVLELGLVHGGTLQMLASPLTDEVAAGRRPSGAVGVGVAAASSAASSGGGGDDDDGTARRARALPRAALRVARLAARNGGALWLDASTALLSARHSAAGGAPRLLGSLLASALATHCGTLWPAGERGTTYQATTRRTSSGGGSSGGGSGLRLSQGWTGAPPASASQSAERCAVCFSGWAGVSVANGGASLAANLIKPSRPTPSRAHLPSIGRLRLHRQLPRRGASALSHAVCRSVHGSNAPARQIGRADGSTAALEANHARLLARRLARELPPHLERLRARP